MARKYDKVVYEKYDSIADLLRTLKGRKANNVFKGHSLSSKDNDYSFTKTHSFEEAMEVMRDGYREPLENLKEGIKTNNLNKNFGNIPKVRPQNNVVGCIPHVPNSILNLPQSMIEVKKVPNKVKVVNVIYDMSIRAACSTDTMEQAGTAMLNIVNTLEMRGIRVGLEIVAFNGREGSELATVSVKLKDPKQPVDVLKLSFPLVHPSFFRRIGFNWLETVPTLSNNGFPCGYGVAVANEAYNEALGIYKENIKDFGKNAYYFNIKLASDCNFKPEDMMKRTGLIKVIQ